MFMHDKEDCRRGSDRVLANANESFKGDTVGAQAKRFSLQGSESGE
jgi:hypothetical protein